MSIRDLFLDNDKNYKILAENPSELREDGESIKNISATFQNRERFIPRTDFSKPENFAHYGSAEKYYETSVARIYGEYPYDGSSAEKQTFLNESTYMDLWLLENKYPRTNGYVYMGRTADLGAHHDAAGLYFASTDTDEYINLKGGPHTASSGMIGKPIQSTFNKSNVYDTDIYEDVGFAGSGTREGNLKCDPAAGTTVEFWLKKPVWSPMGPTNVTEVILDLSGSNNGRFNISISSASAGISIEALYQAGSPLLANSYSQLVSGPGSSPGLATVSSWNHYALSYANSGSVANWKLYVNGNQVGVETDANQPPQITGSLQANIGALTSLFPGAVTGTPTVLGDGKLTGSLDEFRFWKEERSPADIGRYWRTQVYGGTNTDISNTTLGVYYKFNEGIVGNASIDSSVLDYSGRVTNGNWIGYTSTSRATSSAMVLAGVIDSEFKDPIIYPENTLVSNVLTELKASGSTHDVQNGTSFFNLFPNWIIEDDEAGSGDLRNLTQIMSSYLDTLQLQIEEFPKLKNIQYFSGSYSKELPFLAEILEGSGFVAPEIFANASVLNQVFKRSETDRYAEDLTQVKNLIYRNIYNNLLHIYKSKGTEKSFRNLIRCYGVDDSLIKLNLYSNNLTYELEETYKTTTEKRRYSEFYNPSNFEATVYQQTSSLVPDSINYIATSSAGSERYTSFTLEADVILPRKRRQNENGYFGQSFNTSSIMGFHSARALTPADLMWQTTDYDLRIYAVRPRENNNLQDAYFELTSSHYGIALRTDTFKDVYDNKKWQFGVRFRPQKNTAPFVSGSTSTNYWIEFYGVQSDLDVVRREFSLSSSLSSAEYITEPKRIYGGAHRQDYTGSILDRTDIRLGGIRYWMSYLSDDTLKTHSRDPFNAGTPHPYQGSYLFEVSGTQIPQSDTLTLDWAFSAVSSSDALGQFLLYDLSSGSATSLSRYGWFSEISEKQHTGKGDFYPASTTIVNAEYVPIARSKDPESLKPSLTSINIVPLADQEAFTRTKRPADYFYSLEKSMYSTISEEMLRYFSTIVDFNDLIGDPVNRYRGEYKNLEKLRNLFFENIENTPDLEKYIEYYKWIDDSLSTMLMQLIPASSDFSDGIRTVIESHILERNKYRNKFPLLEIADVDPSSVMSFASTVPYALNSPTLPSSPPPTNAHCYWWKNRVNRTNYRITSGDAQVDSSRNYVLSASVSALKHRRPLKFSMKRDNIYGPGLNADTNHITNYIKSSIQFGSTNGMAIPESQVKEFLDCDDVLDPLVKKKWAYETQNQIINDEYNTGEGPLFAPFVAISSSVTTGYNKVLENQFKSGFSLENMHIDAYIDGEVPLQGPFTQEFVGGNQHRHIAINQGSDSPLNRPEAWNIQFDTAPVAMRVVYQPVNSPRATFYRDLVAKRSVNIANIKQSSTGTPGNYSKDYEIVQTCGRHINNIAYVHSGGFGIVDIPSPYVAGMDDYAKPQRGRTEYVFVNRFSSPGSPDTAGDSNGGPALDPESAEYSPYNNLNYRNTSVRWINDLLLSSHVNQFGFYSDNFNLGYGPSTVNSLNYEGTASIYQVNRNPISQLKYSGSSVITASVYDNYWVQHPIPRTDKQYAWITASMTSYDTFGYLPYDGEGSLITFSSASHYVSWFFGDVAIFGRNETTTTILPEAYHTDYVGLNMNLREPTDYTSAHRGYPLDSVMASYINAPLIYKYPQGDGSGSVFNSLNLKRNGPYHYPTWKQIRNADNPVVRKWKENGITAYNLSPGTPLMGPKGISSFRRFGPLKVLIDPPVISKYKPLRLGLKTAVEVNDGKYPAYMTLETTKLKNTYGNTLGQFANDEVTQDVRPQGISDADSSYRAVLGLYTNGALDQNESPVREFEFLTYSEQVYPAAINCYMKRNRERVGYENTFWKDSRLARTILGKSKFGGVNSQGFSVSQSAWALDTAEQFGVSLSTYIAQSASIGASGELQNDYTIAWSFDGTSSLGSVTDIEPAPLYTRKHTLGSCLSVIDPLSINQWKSTKFYPTFGPCAGFFTTSKRTILTASFTYLNEYEIPAAADVFSPFNQLGSVSLFGGNAKFEAHKQAGRVEEGVFVDDPSSPFYDKYDLWAYNMRIFNKDMSLIPEYCMSKNIDKYLKDSNGYTSENTSSFEIVGINSANTQTISYLDTSGAEQAYTVKTTNAAPQNSSEDDFYRIYSFSDFMRYFEIVEQDHSQLETSRSLTLSCKAFKKFIAYDGFYPSERTLEMGKIFDEVYGDYIQEVTASSDSTATTNFQKRPVISTLFAPGILFNTIKSGLAVDYPVYTGSYEIVNYYNNSGSYSTPSSTDYTTYYAIGSASSDNGRWQYRVPFEAILDPEIIEGIEFKDMEPHPSCSIGTDISAYLSPGASKNAQNNKYKLSMYNFLGEVSNFFLEDQELTFLESLQENEFQPVTASVSYAMRIKIRRSMSGQKREVTSYPTPQEYLSNGDGLNFVVGKIRTSTINMYSRPTAFGPPVAGTGSFKDSIQIPYFNGLDPYCSSGGTPTKYAIAATASVVYDSLYGYNVSYTPPYYNGEAWIDLIYTPSTSGKPTIDDIQANSEIVCWRVDGHNPDAWPSGDLGAASYPMHSSSVNNYAMQLTSSINFINKRFVESVVDPSQNSPSWSIQTKFETPILNFGPHGAANYSATDYSYLDNITLPTKDGNAWIGYGGQTTTPIGMWHQFGSIPTQNQGIFLEVGDIEEPWLAHRASLGDISSKYNAGKLQSLASIVGFGKKSPASKKLGRLADAKAIYEAVVAVPFIEGDEKEKLFFEIPTVAEFGRKVPIKDRQPSTIFAPTISKNVLEMAQKVKEKYVFPPQFDFIRNLKAKPVAMYIFDFEHVFTKDDLSYIWQNIAPKLGNEFQEATTTISHPLLEGEILSSMKDRVRWMVFKVKQRAENNYYNKIEGSTEVQEFLFSYNWPYDYFSMIEFAKIDSSVHYGEESAAVLETTPTASTTLLRKPFGTDINLISENTAAELSSTRQSTSATVEAATEIKKREPKK